MDLVYDDVAFFFLVQALLTIFLVPATIYWFCTNCCGQWRRAPVKKFEVVDPKHFGLATPIVDEPKWTTKYLKCKYFLFALLWVFFLYHSMQMPKMQGEQLTAFKPYEILGLEQGASDDDIKKAYRKLSLKWHPDKNPDNLEEAEKNFILISKAHQTLTDPAHKEKFEEFGNPDGYQGVSVSVGLPSWMRKKEHSLRILLVYFLVLIVLPPIAVFIWWRSSSQYHDSGVMYETMRAYYTYISEHMSTKFLIEILAMSVEYQVLERRPLPEADFKKLHAQVKEEMVKQRFNRPYIMRASTLLHAHILRVPIPESLQEDLKIVLKPAHKLLSIMLELCIQKRNVRAAMGAVELMQWITQATWNSDQPLLQLPHFTSKDFRMANKKRLGSIAEFRAATMEKRKKVVKNNNITAEQWADIDKVLNVFPDMDVTTKVVVEDEEGVFEEDFVTVNVTLTRMKAGARRAEGGAAGSAAEDDDDDDEEEEDGKEKTKQGKKPAGKPGKVDKSLAVAERDEDADIDDPLEQALVSKKKLTEEEEREVEKREQRLMDEIPLAETRRKQPTGEGPLVSAVFFPWPKREEWIVLLLAGPVKKKRREAFNPDSSMVVGFQRVTRLDEGASTVVPLRFRVGNKGVWPFELHVRSDSYVGCDIKISLDVPVRRLLKPAEDAPAGHPEDEEEEEEEDELDKEDPPAQWYYLGASSFLEFLVNLVVLGVMAFFAFNFLQTRGYWQKYFEPVIARVGTYTGPVWAKVHPVIRPATDPLVGVLGVVWKWLSDRVVTTPVPKAKRRASKKKQDL